MSEYVSVSERMSVCERVCALKCVRVSECECVVCVSVCACECVRECVRASECECVVCVSVCVDVESPPCFEKPLPTLSSKKLPTVYFVCVIGQEECWAFVVVTFRNLRRKLHMRIRMVSYIDVYKAVQLQSRPQHTGTRSAAVCVIAQQYSSATFVSLRFRSR